MLRNIGVTPLAAESLGVRSMCTYVETSDVKILLDAGVSLCPNRFGLVPHPREFMVIAECRKKIADAADKAEIVTLSHYHFDHHTPSFEDWVSQWTEATETARQIYEGKTVLMKNPREQINYSQRRRGWTFQRTGGKYARKLETADNTTFIFGETRVMFSEPVPHGPEDSFLGWVLMTTVEHEDEKFMFAPDVQGPISLHTLGLILDTRPHLLMLGGPPSYLAGFKVDERQIQTGLTNLAKVVQHVPTTIIEHHLLRDEDWLEKASSVLSKAEESEHRVVTSAEFSGSKNDFLEAKRKKLFTEDPPPKDFQKWMRLKEKDRLHSKPPI